MRNPLTWLSRWRHSYEPLIKVEISKSRILNNFYQFHKLTQNGQIAPVLKSNAYGHGILLIAKILEEARYKHLEDDEILIPFFVVDSHFEALALRSKGIRTPILVIGYTRPETVYRSKIKNVNYVISSLDSLIELANTKYPISIHLKIDTGMNRQGISYEEIENALEIIHQNKKINLQGICSHLSDADNSDSSFTEKQIGLWNRIVDEVTHKFPQLEYIHLSATYGHHYYSKIKSNVTRLGLGLYGSANGFQDKLNLEPALEMKTVITSVKNIKAGDSVGYNNTFKAKKNMTIATIPVGYFEGLDRRLSNIGFVEVTKDRISCPIVGRVSMNITTIDVSNVKDIRVGTEVTVISNNPKSNSSIHTIAKLCNDIEYNVAIHIPENLRRVVVE